jgi:hypothetical protein
MPWKNIVNLNTVEIKKTEVVENYVMEGKAMLRQADKYMNSEVDYFKGEKNPAEYWPKEYLRKK